MSLADLTSQLNQQGVDTNKDVERDSLGGNLKESNVYPLKIVAAYTLKSSGGALGFTFLFKDTEGNEITETQYITNRKGQPFYVKDGKSNPLPGFSTVNNAVKLLLGKDIGTLVEQDTVINIYSRDEQKKVPTTVKMYPELRDKVVKAGILHKVVNKQEKQGTDYVDTNEKREVNEIVKYFDAETNKTNAELLGNAPAEFMDKWLEKFKGKVIDRFKPVANAPAGGASGGTTESPFKNTGQNQPAEDLFGGNS